jgi:hypothetical protein
MQSTYKTQLSVSKLLPKTSTFALCDIFLFLFGLLYIVFERDASLYSLPFLSLKIMAIYALYYALYYAEKN